MLFGFVSFGASFFSFVSSFTSGIGFSVGFEIGLFCALWALFKGAGIMVFDLVLEPNLLNRINSLFAYSKKSNVCWSILAFLFKLNWVGLNFIFSVKLCIKA